MHYTIFIIIIGITPPKEVINKKKKAQFIFFHLDTVNKSSNIKIYSMC